ncbi:hypothetical protein DNTS_022594 [Danionella cerebrum]|uniref:DNA replication complex GINS protein SLD5 n=1 Tax=Danionella cerebrum TaxID=2873325 RepID=A0A553PR89_9TELE|nr:hypothetical protein DNTS_022594 [Danionella translucida]TRY80208.1 hypothetical protein DNTS_022594 [Danionella translucida]
MADESVSDAGELSGGEESQEELVTPAELISKLEELLENKSEVVECVMEQLTHMEENLQRVKRGDLKASIHRMEIDRIRFKEKSRADGDSSFLSPEEFAFAKEYQANAEVYLRAVALKHMPPNLQSIDLLKAVAEPCLDSFVFLRVKEKQDNILVEPETDEQREYVVDLDEGSQHLMRYRAIAPLVASGAVQLI